MIDSLAKRVEPCCPDTERLRMLLDSNLTEAEQREIVRHLDECDCCQHSLEDLATEDWSWSPEIATPQTPPADDSAFWPMVGDLKQHPVNFKEYAQSSDPNARTVSESRRDETIALDFLSPSDEPGYLGRLGRFHAVEVVGRGGMGVVIKALDECLQRFVAIKVLDPQFATNETARTRFCREARAAAAVTHENVIAIHQVEREEANDLPYLVMEYVAGKSLQDRLEGGKPLELKSILRIAMQTAAGLAAAHARGLIHRDVKPANILLQDGLDRVRLSDFGLARAAEDVKLTQTGFVAGTPLYMAPEQARGEPLDHRTDLFSLGSVIYAMCTGKPPFQGTTPFVVLRQVTEEAPTPIADLNPDVPDWLVAIIEKLHAKRPDDRFQSAAEVAELFAARLAEHQVSVELPRLARATRRSAAQRFFARARRRQWMPAALLVLIPTIMFLAETFGFTHWHERFQTAAPTVSAPAEISPLAILLGSSGPVWSLAFAPDAETLAVAIDDGTVKLWDPLNHRVRATLNGHDGGVWTVAYSNDGSLIATAGDDGTAKLWDTITGREKTSLRHSASVRSLAFSPDGEKLATGARDGAVHIWNVANEMSIQTTKAHKGAVRAVAFSPDGKTLASAGLDRAIKLWNADSGQEQITLSGHSGGVYSLAFSPGGDKLVSGGWDKTVRIWDVASGEVVRTLHGHTLDVWSVAFSPKGDKVASAGEDRTVRLWDVASGIELSLFPALHGAQYCVAFSPDGKTLASGGREGNVRLWDLSTAAEAR